MDPVHATQLDFAVNLLREASLAQPTASLVVSPISVAIALSMVSDAQKSTVLPSNVETIAKALLGLCRSPQRDKVAAKQVLCRS